MRSPWNAGSISLLMLHVRVAVEQEHGVEADDRLEHHRPLPGVQHVGGRRVDLLDLIRLGDDHERRRQGKARCEALAVASAETLEVRQGTRPEAHRLQQRRIPGPWGKAGLQSRLLVVDAYTPASSQAVRKLCDVHHGTRHRSPERRAARSD
jgi:hypothetical protein